MLILQYLGKCQPQGIAHVPDFVFTY